MISRIILTASAVALLATAASAREAEPTKVMPNGEKIVCKRDMDTGSLVRATKRCYTRGQWDRIAEGARANAQRITSDHASLAPGE